MFIAARVLCSTVSKRISSVGIVMFICSVSLPQGFLEFHSCLAQMTLQLLRRHLALESFRHLSGAALRVLCVSEEKREAKAAWLALPPPASHCQCHRVCRRCSSTHPGLAGISRGKKKYLFILSAPAKRVVPICVENLQVLCVFFLGIPPIFEENPKISGISQLFLSL